MDEKEKKPRSLHEIPCTLSDTEWMALINKEREGLPICCSNISELRDQIIQIARDGAMLPPWNGIHFLRSYRVARDGHELNDTTFPILMRLVSEIAESMGYTVDEVNTFPHQGNGE